MLLDFHYYIVTPGSRSLYLFRSAPPYCTEKLLSTRTVTPKGAGKLMFVFCRRTCFSPSKYRDGNYTNRIHLYTRHKPVIGTTAVGAGWETAQVGEGKQRTTSGSGTDRRGDSSAKPEDLTKRFKS